MITGQHLDNQTTYTPDIGFLCVNALFHNLRGHPKHRTLERGSVRSITGQEIYAIW
jgi:hypothetical protein